MAVQSNQGKATQPLVREKPVAKMPGPAPMAAPKVMHGPPKAPGPNYAARGFWLAVVGGGMVFAAIHFKDRGTQPENRTPVIAIEVKRNPIPETIAAPAEEPAADVSDIAEAAAPGAPAPMPMAEAPKPVEEESAAQPKPEPAAIAGNPFFEPLVLDAVAGKKAVHRERAEKLLRATLAENKWPEYQDLLKRSLARELKKSFGFTQPNSYDRLLDNPLFHQALLQNAFAEFLPADARSMIQEYAGDREFYLWLLTTPAALEEWLIAARPGDQLKDALKTWAILQAEAPSAREKYRSLAIACALVFDKDFRPEWNGERLEISASLRFDYYAKHDEKGELATHISQMSVADLIWVVAAPVPNSELDWARKEVRLRQRDWGDSYGMVPYDMEKAVTGKQKKPYESYTFSEILEKGGICGDRTYFGVNTARAMGIPAAPLSGDGPLGSHAWMAWKADRHTWKTSGRIGGYGAGNTHDPQIGRGISEVEFTRLSDRRANSDALTAKANRFLWLADLHEALDQKEDAGRAVEFAFSTNRGRSELWLAKLEHWRKTRKEAPVDDWRKFMTQWKKEFANDSEMLAVARQTEQELIVPRLDVKIALQDMRKDVRALDRTRNDGPPLTAGEMAASFRRQADLYKKENDYTAIRGLYHRAFRERGGDAAAFKQMARDFFGLCRDDKEAAIAACREIESSYERFVESNTNGWFEVQSQNSVAAFIADCWKTVGETDRAEKILKDTERRTRRSKRSAI